MKVLLINGSPHQFGCTYTALKEVADSLNRNDITTEIYHIGAALWTDCFTVITKVAEWRARSQRQLSLAEGAVPAQHLTESTNIL